MPSYGASMVAKNPSQEAASGGSASTKKWRGRSILSLVLFIVATILTPAAAVGHWAHTTVTDTQVYVDTVGPLAKNAEIQEAVGKIATDAVVKQIDTKKVVGGFLTQLLPDDDLAATLTGPLSAGVNQVISSGVRVIMSTDAFQTAWDATNKAAQRSLIATLEGDPKGVVQIKGADVVLDISSLLEEIQKSLVKQGIDAAAKVKIPESDSSIVLMSAPAFEQLRTIWAFSNPVLSFILLIVAILFTVSVLLATRRARTTVVLGITLFVIGAAMRLSLPWAQSQITNNFTNTVFENASVAFFQALQTNLVEGVVLMMLLGVILVFVGWFIGGSDSALRARTALDRGFADIASQLPEWAPRIGRPLRAHATAVQLGLLFLWLITVFTATQFRFESTLGWTLLILGLLTVARILMTASEPDRVIRENEDFEIIES